VNASGADHLVFRAVELSHAAAPPLPEGYRLDVWRPSLRHIVPPGVPRFRYAAWWAFDRGRVFRNPGYAVVLVTRGGQLAHRLGVFPGWFRFPFMEPDDLQLGDLWTSPAHRGRGIASHAIGAVVRTMQSEPRRAFWYLVHEHNVSSIRAVERAGFQLHGRAVRTSRLGVRLLGGFEVFDGSAP